jgi:hypothetical protein
MISRHDSRRSTERLKEIVDLLASEKDHHRYLELMKEMSAILDEIDVGNAHPLQKAAKDGPPRTRASLKGLATRRLSQFPSFLEIYFRARCGHPSGAVVQI